MSNIEKIRQEIERQLEYFKGKEDDTWDDCDNYTDEDAMWYQGHWKMCSRLLSFIDSLPEEKPSEDLEEAAIDFADNARKQLYSKDYAISSIADYDHGCIDGFKAGANYRRLKRLAEAAKSSSHLDAYIEGVRRSIEKQIGQLPPPPPGYYYTWELDTIRMEGQSFTAIARPILKQINPEHDEQLKAKH